MKVILKGINRCNKTNETWYELLEQVPFPVEVEVIEDLFVSLKQYIKDPKSPDSEEEWGLPWFIYEEVKEVQD